MKNIFKLIAITAALVIGAGAFAKTLPELAAELQPLEGWEAKVAWANTNAADIEAVFPAYKALPESQTDGWTPEKDVFGLSYLSGACTFATATDWELCCMHAGKYIEEKSKTNPTLYAEIKAAGWKIGDNQITEKQRICMAYTMRDFDYFVENNQPELFEIMYIDGCVAKWFTKKLLAMPDTAKAKSICNNIVAALIVRDKADKYLKIMQVCNKELTARALDAKIVK